MSAFCINKNVNITFYCVLQIYGGRPIILAILSNFCHISFEAAFLSVLSAIALSKLKWTFATYKASKSKIHVSVG